MALVADTNRACPGGAVVVGVGQIDLRPAAGVEFSPGDVESAEMVTGAMAGDDGSGLVVRKLAVERNSR